MWIFKKLKSSIAIFVVLLFICGNVTYADEVSSLDSEKHTSIKIIEIDIAKEIIDEINPTVSEETEISTFSGKLIEKLPSSMAVPSGTFVSTARANSNASTLGYGNAHNFKTEMIKAEA